MLLLRFGLALLLDVGFLRGLLSFGLLLRLCFCFGLDFGLGRLDFGFVAPAELRLDQIVSVLLHAAETVLGFNLALVQKVNDDLNILVKFVRHVKDSVLRRF